MSLSNLRYPFVLSKSSMYSVGAPHTWPLALGALMWLIDNIKVGKKKALLIAMEILNVARRYRLKPALCLLFIRSSGVWVRRRCCSVISARTATTLRKGLNITRFFLPYECEYHCFDTLMLLWNSVSVLCTALPGLHSWNIFQVYAVRRHVWGRGWSLPL